MSTMPLWWRQLARRYEHAVATPPTIAAGELCLAAGDLDQDLEHLIARGPRRCPRERLLVYQRQYWLRLIDVLQTELPTLVPLLGIDAFNHLALRYLIAYPPDAAELHRLTRHWPHWQALIGGPPHLVQAARWDVQRAELFAAPAPACRARVADRTMARLAGTAPRGRWRGGGMLGALAASGRLDPAP